MRTVLLVPLGATDARPAEARRAVEAALALMPGRWLSLRGLPQGTEAPAVAAR